MFSPCLLFSTPPSPLPPSLSGNDVTVVGYGAQIQVLRNACKMAQEQLNISCDLIDLRTLLPWDIDTVAKVQAPWLAVI